MTSLLAAIVLFSFITFCTYVYCWQDIKRGTPHILSLRQITLIMDRHVLNQMFGKHAAGYRYVLPPAMVSAVLYARAPYMVTQLAAEFFCMFGALRYLTGSASHETLGIFLMLVILCEGIDIWFSIVLARRWWHQIQEEIDGME